MALNIQRLNELLAANKMSYQDLADITHINKATLHRYFTGVTKKIPIERIWPIAFALNTTPQYIMGDTDDPNPHFAAYESSNIRREIIELINQLNDRDLRAIMAFISVLTKEEA